MSRPTPAPALVGALSALAALAALAASSPALAEVSEAPQAPRVVQPAVRHFIFGQALAIVVRRLSFGYELLLPGSHHSFGITVHGQWPGTKYLSVARGEVAGLGAELGYRYYAGEGGPTGPFFGVSMLAGYYHSRASFYEEDRGAVWYAQRGWAIDLGWATYLDRTIVVAVAAGVQRTWINIDRALISDQAQLIDGEGLRPRAQLQIGRVF